MKVAVFTSNQPRHVALLDALTRAGHDVVAVIEPKSWLSPPELTAYWHRVRLAEAAVFPGEPLVRVPALIVRSGELSRLEALPPSVHAVDRCVVFSSSYLTGWLAELLIAREAVNLHVGIAPEYRGSAPNAWAVHDGRHDLVGAQVQRLSRGLDAGEILAEVRPPLGGEVFRRGMEAVRLGIQALVDLLDTPEPWRPVRANDRALQLRYSRHADFTEAVATRILVEIDQEATRP